MKIFTTKLKFILLLLLSGTILFIQQWQTLLALFIIILTTICFFDKRRKILSKIIPLLIAGVAIILFSMIFNYSLNYSERLFVAIITAIKITTLSLAVFVFTITTSPKEIMTLFTFLPKKIQLILTITLSIIPIIISEAQKIRIIQKARGLNYRGINIVKNIFPIIVPLLHRSFQRAEQMAMVLYTKGYEV